MTNGKQIEHAIKRVADAEIEAARKYRDAGIEDFKGEQDMISMFRQDCRNRIEAARLAKKGQIIEARRKVSMMDTAARDAITDEFFDMLDTLSNLVK